MEVGKMEPTDATTQAKCQSEEKHRSACWTTSASSGSWVQLNWQRTYKNLNSIWNDPK
jgi:hypothetical protein